MKKKMALILTTAAVMGLAGCSGQTAKTETTAASAAETTSEQTTQAKSEAAETTKASAETAKKDVSGKITLYTSQPEEDAQKLSLIHIFNILLLKSFLPIPESAPQPFQDSGKK